MVDTFTILVIDDDPAVLETVTNLLAAAGYRALAAASGPEGLALARVERPDLVLLDLYIPGMDGAAVLGALKADAATRTIPAVALTAAIATDVGRLVAAGCNGYIPKPLVPGTFLPLIRQFLRASVARAPGPRQ